MNSMWLWLGLAILGVALIFVGLAVPASRHAQERPAFRLYIRATDPDLEGLRSWHYQVRDETRLDGGQVVVEGACITWGRALEDGLFQLHTTMQGWAWQQENR